MKSEISRIVVTLLMIGGVIAMIVDYEHTATHCLLMALMFRTFILEDKK